MKRSIANVTLRRKREQQTIIYPLHFFNFRDLCTEPYKTVRVAIDENGEIWLAYKDIFNALGVTWESPSRLNIDEAEPFELFAIPGLCGMCIYCISIHGLDYLLDRLESESKQDFEGFVKYGVVPAIARILNKKQGAQS